MGSSDSTSAFQPLEVRNQPSLTLLTNAGRRDIREQQLGQGVMAGNNMLLAAFFPQP